MNIQTNLSAVFFNKENRAEMRPTADGGSSNRWAFGYSFVPMDVTQDELAAHILAGRAWTQGHFKNTSRRKETFVSSQTLSLDFDQGNVSVESALKHPFIARYAWLIHPSPSSTESFPKTRVIFALSEPVDDYHRWEALQLGLLHHFQDLKPDSACKDAARLFYGSNKPGWKILNNTLPLVEAGGLTAVHAWTELEWREKPERIYSPSSSSARRFLDVAEEVERVLGFVNKKTDNDGFYTERIVCPFHNHEHDNTDPAFVYHPTKHFGHCHKRNETYNLFAIARRLGIEVTSKRDRQNIKADPKNIPAPVAPKLEDIIQKSLKKSEEAAQYLLSLYNVSPYISRARMVGALPVTTKVNNHPLSFTRYLIPNYFKDRLYGARITLDETSARMAWWRFEQENPSAFKAAVADIPYDECEVEYWTVVFQRFFGGRRGFVEAHKLYNIGACIELTTDQKIKPRAAQHLVIVPDNDELEILALLSAGYCAVGAQVDANMKWLFSKAHRRIILAKEWQEPVAKQIAAASETKDVCYIPAQVGVVARHRELDGYLERFGVYGIENTI